MYNSNGVYLVCSRERVELGFDSIKICRSFVLRYYRDYEPNMVGLVKLLQ